jgi:hypothetical protein
MEVALAPDILALRAQLCEVERRADIAEAEAANDKAANADLLASNALLELQIEIDETRTSGGRLQARRQAGSLWRPLRTRKSADRPDGTGLRGTGSQRK